MNFLHHTDARISQLKIYASSSPDLSNSASLQKALINPTLHESMLQYFLKGFKEPVFYQFREASEHSTIIRDAFDDETAINDHLVDLVKKIVSYNNEENAPLAFVITAHLKNVIVEDEVLDAIAVFVTEDDPKFLCLEDDQSDFSLSLKKGFHGEKIYQGILIFNSDAQSGFKICAKDRSKPFQTETPWMTDLLQLTSMPNAYLNTKETIKLTKQFVKEQAKESPQLDKTYEAEIMNNSLQYFQEESDFSQQEYTQRVFNDPELQTEFSAYREAYQENKEKKLADNFSVNLDAVKNQSKVFKSVLKLDKNFHVYIHGDRQLIERGTDDTGRKFYKLFYQEEK